MFSFFCLTISTLELVCQNLQNRWHFNLDCFQSTDKVGRIVSYQYCENRVLLHLFRTLISFIRVLWFSTYKFCKYFVRLTVKFHFWGAFANDILISSYIFLMQVCRKAINFSFLILHPVTFHYSLISSNSSFFVDSLDFST